MNLNSIAANYSDEDKARKFFESVRWPNGQAVCPHCGVIGEATELPPIANKPKRSNGEITYRKGVWKCNACRKQFTARMRTIFEDSHIPLSTWLKAIHLMCASKKGISSHQLHRMLGVTYKSAWFMSHRIRYAMSQEPLKSKLSGTVEVDECYIGGKPTGYGRRGRPGRWSKKVPVVAIVQRDGGVRSFHVPSVTSQNLKAVIRENVESSATVNTDDFNVYKGLDKEFAGHDVIRHKSGYYSRREDGRIITTNAVEGFFAILKRGVNGTFHHISREHLHRYLSEFDFRYSTRKLRDGERTALAIKGIEGKRLMLKDPIHSGN
jgi:transposase-like protein